MHAHDLGNFLLSLKDNPMVLLWEWDEESYSARHWILNSSGGKHAEGYVYLNRGLFMSDVITRAEKTGMKENSWEKSIDFKKILDSILNQKEWLPALMGIDENFDKLIAEKLKEKDDG